MNRKIFRSHFRGCLKSNCTTEALAEAIASTKKLALELQTEEKLLTAGMFQYENMLFVYYESIDEEYPAEKLLSAFHGLVETWPEREGIKDFARMHLVFYFAIPEGLEDWKRKNPPTERCGRIAFLREHNMYEYVAHHVAITEEGYLLGEKSQSIALHENILFSYYEEPRLKEINVKRDLTKKSLAIDEWIAKDPGSHFYCFEDDAHFQKIDCLFAIG